MPISSQQKRRVLRAARNNPAIIIDAIEETIRFMSESQYRDLDPVKIASLRDDQRQIRLWVQEKQDDSFSDDHVVKLFIASRFPNPIHPGDKKKPPSRSWTEMIKFFGRK